MSLGDVVTRVVEVTQSERDAAAAILDEYLQSIREAVDPRDLSDEIDRHISGEGWAMWIALQGDDVAGCVSIHRMNDSGHYELKRLYVRPAFRRLGLAAELMGLAEEFASTQGGTAIYLDTKKTMLAAIALYESRGYEQIDPYHITSEADVFLRKTLQPEPS